jgi:GNAT superfamily N-acetyltransferase
MVPGALSHRPVQADDLPLICSFPQSAEELFFLAPRARHPLDAEQLSAAIAQRFDSTVALLDGRVSAFANFYVRERGGTCAIGNVVVDPSARGRGVGGYLVETMARAALRVHGASLVKISCFHANVAGLLLYAKLGFEPYAIEQRKGPDGGKVALIHLRLGEQACSRLR